MDDGKRAFQWPDRNRFQKDFHLPGKVKYKINYNVSPTATAIDGDYSAPSPQPE